MQPTEDDTLSSLEKMRGKLYASNQTHESLEGSLKPQAPSEVPHTWTARVPLGNLGATHHVHFAFRFFIATILFFLVALGFAAYLFFSGANAVSVDNVAVLVQGPTTVASGDIVPLSIAVTNKNSVGIKNVILAVDFPQGTRSADDLTIDYPRYREEMGALSSGQTVETSIKAVLFGGQGTEIRIPVNVSYEAESSNAVFTRKAVYTIVISTAPLSVSVSSISETVSGRPFSIEATVRSNAATPLQGVVLAAQYPPGYSLVSASVPNVGNNFPLGALNPGDSKKVRLTGILTGQNNEEKVFHFTVGTAKSANDPSLSVGYMTQEASVTIAAPFLATTLSVNGSSVESSVVAPGSQVSVRVDWSNTLPVALHNVSVEVALSGTTLDQSSVSAQTGFYRSSDSVVIFNRDTDPSLTALSPGSRGFGIFTFKTTSNAPRGSVINLTLSVAGERVGQTGVPEAVTASSVKTIKIASALTLTTSASRMSGAFLNTGPVPPTVNVPTSYTILWQTGNAGNDIADGVITATLPTYVTFSGLTAPADGSISYDASSRTVTWRVGDIRAGTTRQGAFQVLLTPSVSQRGGAPNLTSAPVFSGFDRFVQAQVTIMGAAVNTETKADPGYVPKDAVVQ